MKQSEDFMAGYQAAIEVMKAYDGPALVTDELVEHLEEQEGTQLDIYKGKCATGKVK
jgi:hypothetical protein